MTRLKWGIVSTGNMARLFAADFGHSTGGVLHAVCSRDSTSAQRFAADFDMPHGFGSLEELLAADVEVVYIASPHTAHFETAMRCLKAGRHVLCEKPMTLRAAQTEALFEVAAAQGVFLMEGLWTRFNPAVKEMLALVQSGAIGRVKSVDVQFGFNARVEPEHRLLNRGLGGGALLDVGVYPLFLAQTLLGAPQDIELRSEMGPTGVDVYERVLLGYGTGATATLTSALDRYLGNRALVSGTKGSIELPRTWWESRSLMLWTERGGSQELSFDFPGRGWHFEASHVNQCIAAGRLTSELFGAEQSILLSKTTQALLDEMGLIYS